MKQPKLTTAERALKRNIEEIEAIVTENRKTLWALRKMCADRGHKIVPRDLEINKKLKTNMWASTGAYCLICGQSFGWWCPESPEHYCSYKKSKNPDDCDYCHMPSERK